MGTDKALLAWPPRSSGGLASGETFVSAIIKALIPNVDLVVVVVRGNASLVMPAAYAAGASTVTNFKPEQGQFSSLQVGLREVLNRGRDAAVITLVDRPPAQQRTLHKLLEHFRLQNSDEKWAVVPEYSGQHGHPIIFGREMIEAVLRSPATATAREVEHRNQQYIEYVPVDDPFVILNINTPQDYAELPPPA
jgi:molybdenum cofactor cytidylyltransferase